MRNMSFSLTTEQVRNRQKTVTRRLGWRNLQKGEIIQAVVKGMGLKKGEKVQPICLIKIKSVWFEGLNRMSDDPFYGACETEREGFPRMSGKQFVEMFCKHNRCAPETVVTRIEFSYL